MKTIIILGRTNVGKSTLFNILKQNNTSIINELPGSTRDYILCIANIFNIKYKIMDTPGIDLRIKKIIIENKIKRTDKLIKKVDLIFFIINGRKNILESDFFLLNIILKTNKKIFLLINKTETKILLSRANINKLGLGKGIFISAKHQIGIYNIYLKIKRISKIKRSILKKRENLLSIALIGKTNVGKSTFFNSVLGFRRNIISKNSDTTRDFIETKINFQSISISLFDTAGVKNNIGSNLEKFSINKSIYLINKSDIILVMISSENIIDKQELILLKLVIKKNKLLILVINKRDLVRNIKVFKKKVNFIISKKVFYIKDIFIFFSFKEKNIKKTFFLKKIIFLWKRYNLKIKKEKLDILAREINVKNKSIKILSIKQNKKTPLKFLFIMNKIKSEVYKGLENLYIDIIKKIFKLNHLYVKINFVQK